MDLEDKLLGYKAQNYVSSSESEDNDDECSDQECACDSKLGKEKETPQLDFRIDGPKVCSFYQCVVIIGISGCFLLRSFYISTCILKSSSPVNIACKLFECVWNFG